MQLYSENEKAFLLIHLKLNYGTDWLPYCWGQGLGDFSPPLSISVALCFVSHNFSYA